MESLGEIFKRQREEMGFSLDDVEEETKIRKFYIRAIEDNQFDLLPARVYAVGFVKRYARLLELDEDLMAKEFKRIAFPEEKQEEELVLTRNSREKTKLTFKNVVAGVLFFLVVVWIGTYLVEYMATRSTRENPFASRPPVEDKVNQKDQDKTPPPTPQITGVNLQLVGEEKCWVSVTVDGEPIFKGFLMPGDEKEYKGENNIYLVLGNAGGVKVKFNGKDLGYLGERGSVVKTNFPQ